MLQHCIESSRFAHYNMEPFFYNTIERPTQAEFKDRGSRFIAFAYPVDAIEDCKKILQILKKEHPKAVHHCLAYRLGVAGDTFRVSDDGEPSGSAGRPILGQIDSKQLTNVLVIVVRYFGGTLLGVPGLINAYKTATSLALQLTPILQKPIEVTFTLQFDYQLMNDVMMVLKQLGCTVQDQEAQLFVLMHIGVPKNRIADFEYKMADLHSVTYSRALKV